MKSSSLMAATRRPDLDVRRCIAPRPAHRPDPAPDPAPEPFPIPGPEPEPDQEDEFPSAQMPQEWVS